MSALCHLLCLAILFNPIFSDSLYLSTLQVLMPVRAATRLDSTLLISSRYSVMVVGSRSGSPADERLANSNQRYYISSALSH